MHLRLYARAIFRRDFLSHVERAVLYFRLIDMPDTSLAVCRLKTFLPFLPRVGRRILSREQFPTAPARHLLFIVRRALRHGKISPSSRAINKKHRCRLGVSVSGLEIRCMRCTRSLYRRQRFLRSNAASEQSPIETRCKSICDLRDIDRSTGRSMGRAIAIVADHRRQGETTGEWQILPSLNSRVADFLSSDREEFNFRSNFPNNVDTLFEIGPQITTKYHIRPNYSEIVTRASARKNPTLHNARNRINGSLHYYRKINRAISVRHYYHNVRQIALTSGGPFRETDSRDISRCFASDSKADPATRAPFFRRNFDADARIQVQA